MQKDFRRCISCRTIAHKSELWRIVRTHPNGVVTLHEGMGRSAYLCKNPECLHVAIKKRKLDRTLKTKIPQDIYDQLQACQL